MMHRVLTQAARRPLAMAGVRTFNSASVVLAPAAAVHDAAVSSFHTLDHYAKDDHVYDPVPAGTTHYVVSEPEHKNTPYDVPSGAFPTSSPYDHFTSAAKPEHGQPSSTSSSAAHPNTTQRVPTTNDTYPYGSSSAVRHNEAPGQMAKGSDKGVHLAEGVKVTPGAGGELAGRNVWPSEEQGKAGLDEAWKMRK